MFSPKTLRNLMVLFGLLGAILDISGGQWDAWLHVKQGHELFAIPHLIIIAGLVFFALAGFCAFLTLLKNSKELQPTQKRGLWLAMLGGAVVFPALAFDEGWHRFIGLDQTFWSAPHAILFAALAAVLLGLALFTHKNRVLPTLFFATMILLGLFSLGDFDQPHMQDVMQRLRPGFTYPLAVTGIFTFAFLLTMSVTRRIGHGYITAAALLAWGFFMGTGVLVGTIGGFMHAILPFPIVIPALVLELCLFLFDVNFLLAVSKDPAQLSIKPKNMFAFAFFTATACYIAVIAWSALYTQTDTPQQLSGNLRDWIGWYFAAVPLMALASAWIVNKFAQWAQINKEQAPPAEITSK